MELKRHKKTMKKIEENILLFSNRDLFGFYKLF